jgi:flagellar biosynthetic protein FliO
MAQETLFAAPEVAAHGGAAGGAVSVTLALLLVVGVIALLAWFARRARGGGLFGGRASRIQVLSTQPLGVKESAVLVRVGDTDILVGVSQGSVRALHVFPVGANTEAPPAAESAAGSKAPNFKDLMMKSLGMNSGK